MEKIIRFGGQILTVFAFDAENLIIRLKVNEMAVKDAADASFGAPEVMPEGISFSFFYGGETKYIGSRIATHFGLPAEEEAALKSELGNDDKVDVYTSVLINDDCFGKSHCLVDKVYVIKKDIAPPTMSDFIKACLL